MRVRLVALFTGLLLVSLGSGQGQAAGQASVVKRIVALNTKAIAVYRAGDNEQAKALLLDAIVLGKTNGLDTNIAVARSYLNLGLVHVDGMKDEAKGERYFAAALRIDPSIEIKDGAASETVTRVFAQARLQANGDRAKDAEANTAALTEIAPEEPAAPVLPVAESKAIAQKAREEQERLRRDLAQADQRVKKDQGAKERQRLEKLQSDFDHLHADHERLQTERDRLQTERERLSHEKQELESQLAETRIAGKRNKEDLEIQLAAVKTQQARSQQEAEKSLVDARSQDKKNREDAERRLADARAQDKKNQQDAEKAMAEAKEREKDKDKKDQDDKQKLLADKQAVEKRLAEAEQREKNERAAKEKLQEEKRLAEERARTQEREAKEAEAQEKLAREKLALGPDLPGSLPQKLFCSLPDASPPGADIFVHCAVQAEVKADALTLYYRPSGSPRYSTIPMARTKKGWYSAMIPAGVVKGSMLQYYVQADNERGRAVVTNGKPALPNVVMVNRIQAPLAAGAMASSGLVRASARARSTPDRARTR